MIRNITFLFCLCLLLFSVVYFRINRQREAAIADSSFTFTGKDGSAHTAWITNKKQKQIAQTDPGDEIIELPDEPQMQGYAPTSIKDFEAADPTEGISMISTPVANNMGNAILTFQMNLPEGRQGLNPELTMQYNNEGGTTWMGTGWNLNVPYIGIDTRWGVPRYDDAQETEMYLFNGDQLAPVNNRSAFVARSTTDKRFYPRVEGAFSRIIRHGSNPGNYWWEVTEKDGTRHSYGGKMAAGGIVDSAVLKDDDGNIGYWALVESRDPHDNFIQYNYTTVQDPGIAGSTIQGKQLYLSQIFYTGHGTTNGAYKIDFTRDRQLGGTRRPDITIDARLGFKMVIADLLKRVDISYNNQLIRSYRFTYAEGAFYKTILKKIEELDNTEAVFYSQDFEYYDDARNVNTLDYKSADTSLQWQIAGDGISGDVINPIPGFEDDASVISTSKANSQSYGGVVTVGSISGGVWSKKMSVGGGFSYGMDDQVGITNLIDINGDGLPDKVFKDDDGMLYYRANLGGSTRSFGDRRPITGVSDFSTSESESIGGGGQVLPFTGFIGVNHTTMTTTSKVYFTDFNGDGLIDVANGGQIYFNHLTPQGDPEFVLQSELTPSPIVTGTVDPSMLQKDTARQSRQERDFPLQDIIRFWEAPAGGTINITAPVQLQEIPNQTGNVNKKKDGVRASVQVNGTQIWNTIIDDSDYTVHPFTINNLNIAKGQRIYFRLQSIYNGEDDIVSWDPIIQYTTPVTLQSDVHHKVSNYYRASEDFILHSKSVTGMGKDGAIVIGGTFQKRITSDSVTLQITRKRNNVTTVVYERSFAGTELFDGDMIVPGQVSVLFQDEMGFVLSSRSYIDRSAMLWKPHFVYVVITDGTAVTTTGGGPTIQGYPMPDNSNFNNWIYAAPPVAVAQQDTVTLWPQVAGGGDGTLWFSIKGNDTVYARRHILVTGGTMNTAMDSIKMIRKANEPLFLEFATDTASFGEALAPPTVVMYRDSSYVDSNGVTRDTSVLAGTLAANLYSNPRQEFLGPLFRGWGHFSFKGDKGDGPLLESRLNLNELSSFPSDPAGYDSTSVGGVQDPSKSDFVILYPDIKKQSWVGYDTSVYVTGGTMSSSRLYLHDVTVDSMAPGSNTVDKISTTEIMSYSAGATASGIGPSAGYSSATTSINKDMMDMNGDRYPDVIDGQKIQYTLPNGDKGLTIDQQLGESTSSGESGGMGMGGDYQEASTGNKTNKGAAAAQKTAKSSMGISGSVNWNKDGTGSTWTDINGDGLVDRVYGDGTVALNMGYRFAAAENWGFGAIDKATSLSVGGGLGVNIDAGSFEGGFGVARTTGRNSDILCDINGDGLPDKLYLPEQDLAIASSKPQLQVQFNTGTGFAPPINWNGYEDIASIVSVGESFNVAFTVAIPIYIIFIKICINPVASFGHGTSRQEQAFMDLDGDGFADYIQSKNDGQLFASSSAIGRTNMLRTVKGPTGSSFTMDYERLGNTYDMPQSKWVLKNVSVFDGVRGDGVDTMRQLFNYEGGRQDRYEREFYGFSSVITRDINSTTNTVYRSHVQQYLNSTYYNKGLLASEWLQDSAGHKYTQTNNVYDIRVLVDSVRYPALTHTERLFFEGAAFSGASTVVDYEYDNLGNVTHIADAGDGSQQDMSLTDITYHNLDNLYVKSVPATVQVNTVEGLKRKRTTAINQYGDITRINQFLADNTAAVTDIEYDNYGNMSKLTNPANHHSQRMSYNYEYDNAVNSYVTRVTDAIGYATTNEYDYRFGMLTRTVGRNEEPTEFTIDNRGRLTRFTGPYELAAGKPYTIAIDYHPEAVVPYAVTHHYDPEYDGDINVINFVDGLGRSIQMKKQVSLFKGKDVPDDERMVVSGKIMMDAFGRPSRTLYPVTEAKGAINTVLNTALGRVATITGYDVEDRLVRKVLADGATTNTAYSIAGGMISRMITDALGNRREILTDVRDRKQFLKLYGPNGVITTQYDYDALDQLVKVTDNNGNDLTSTYDNFGRLISVQHPDAGKTDFEFDMAGNMIKKINSQISYEIPNGGAIQYQYDYDRLTDIDYPKHYQNKVKYTYGEPGTGARAGRIILQEDGTGGQEFYYSMQGQIVKTIRTVLTSPLFSTTYVSEQEYDSWNRIKKMVYPDGEVIMYHYNKSGGLYSMDATKIGNHYEFVNQLGYDEYDQRVYMRYSNGTENFYKYDSLRRNLSHLRALSSSGSAMMNNSYSYDAVSNVLGFVNDVQTQAGSLGGYAKQQYHYDQLYRLDSASGEYNGSGTANYGLKVSYDNLFNITRKKMSGNTAYDHSYTYGAMAPHRATQVGDKEYEYDLNGNQEGYGDVENFYDEENRLIAVIKQGVLNQYTYDADDNRVVKSSGGMQGIWVNGAPAGAVRHDDNYTVYVSPYISCRQSSFTKNYYIEGQRVITQLGHGTFTNISFPQSGLTAGGVDYTRRASMIENARNEYYASLGVSPGPPTDKNFWARPENSGIAAPVFVDTAGADIPPGWPGNTSAPPNGPPVFVNSIPSRDSVTAGYGFTESGHLYEGGMFYYHFDKVGSTSYVTNFEGKVSQHLEYSPLGETFFTEHAGSFETNYLFSGKGYDDETGYYFYNPQYYDPGLSQWLTVSNPTGEDYLDDGNEAYSLMVDGNDDDEEQQISFNIDANPTVNRIAYNGSQETDKAWVDKKLNTKSRDRLTLKWIRKHSNDPRLKMLGNKYGSILLSMKKSNGTAFRATQKISSELIARRSISRNLSMSGNPYLNRQSTVRRNSEARTGFSHHIGDAANSRMRRNSEARMGASNSPLRRNSTMRRNSNARIGFTPAIRQRSGSR